MINVTTPLGFTRAFTFKVMPVLTPEMLWVKALVPPCCSGVPTWEVSTGTCVPTLMVAGMLSVAMRLGSERM